MCSFCSCSKTYFRLERPISWSPKSTFINTVKIMDKGNGYTFKVDNYVKIVQPPFCKRSTLKVRNLHSLRANSFLLESTIFQKVLCAGE